MTHTRLAQQLIADHAGITYWEIQNEPGGAGYFAPGTVPTDDQLLDQFRYAYDGLVRAGVTPRAIVLPSLIAYTPWNPVADPGQLTMREVLDYLVLHHLQPGVIAFHDNNYTPLWDAYAPQSGCYVTVAYGTSCPASSNRRTQCSSTCGFPSAVRPGYPSGT